MSKIANAMIENEEYFYKALAEFATLFLKLNEYGYNKVTAELAAKEYIKLCLSARTAKEHFSDDSLERRIDELDSNLYMSIYKSS